MTTIFQVNAAVLVKADGTQTVFKIDLVSAPLYLPPQQISGQTGCLVRTDFSCVKPKPSGLGSFSAGVTGVLSGYHITLTYATAPASGRLEIFLPLEYEQ